MPTCSCIVSCRSASMTYGLSPPPAENGARRSCAASSIWSALAAGITVISCAYFAAYSPARRPKTRMSESEFPPRRFAPCSPAAGPPAAEGARAGGWLWGGVGAGARGDVEEAPAVRAAATGLDLGVDRAGDLVTGDQLGRPGGVPLFRV